MPAGESQFGSPPIPRNLLILQDDSNYQDSGFAQLSDTPGTRSFLKSRAAFLTRNMPRLTFLPNVGYLK